MEIGWEKKSIQRAVRRIFERTDKNIDEDGSISGDLSTIQAGYDDAMNHSQSVKKVGLFGANIGNENLGDEATLVAVMQRIKRCYPEATIYAFSSNPFNIHKRYGIPAFPIRKSNGKSSSHEPYLERKSKVNKASSRRNLLDRIKKIAKETRVVYHSLKTIQHSIHVAGEFFVFFFTLKEEFEFLAKSNKRLKEIDLLLIAGGGLLSDHFEGPGGYPYDLLKWSILAKFLKKKVAFVSVGAGPLNSLLSKIFVKCSLRCASYRSFRDLGSKKLIEQIGVTGENHVFPDLAYGLEIKNTPPVCSLKRSQTIVGINPFPHFDHRYWPVSHTPAYQTYVREIALFATWLLNKNYAVMLFPTQLRADTLVIQDIKEILRTNITPSLMQRLIEPVILTVDDLLLQISNTDFIVANRFHGILLSFLMNKPVLGLSNHQKMADLMREVGQTEYLIDANDFDSDALIKCFALLEQNRKAVEIQIKNNISIYRAALENQYDRIFALVE